MLTTIFILLSVTLLSMMSPGPDMMLLIKNSCTGSRRIAFACVLGICASVSLHVFLSIVGLAAIISTSVVLYSAIRYAGALYLIYVGWKTLRSARITSFLDHKSEKVNSEIEAFREGFFCNVLNPKFTVYLVSIFSQFIGPETAILERIVYGALIIFEGFFVWSIFVLLVQTSAVQDAIRKFQVAINRCVGAVLISFGIAVAVKD
jgi:RhtB (resistance to homoserine/threonine) family protein